MFVVIYNPGAAGKMVTAVIDSCDHYLSPITPTVEVKPDSIREQFMSGADSWPEYDNFSLLKKVNEDDFYSAISNHCSDYFIDYFNGNDLIFIDDSDPAINEWCLSRAIGLFPDVHKLNDERLTARNRLHTNIKLYGKKVIHMNDIMNGNLINVLKKWIDAPLNEELYTAWLQNQKLDTYPFELTNICV